MVLALLSIWFLGCESDRSSEEDLLSRNHGSWQFICKGPGNNYFYYNRELVRVTDTNTITLWIKHIDAVPIVKADAAKGRKLVDLPHSVFRFEVSCEREESRTLEVVEIDKAGKRNRLGPEDKNWEAVIPDTVGHMWYKAACSTPESLDSKMLKIVRVVGEILADEAVKEDGDSGAK